MFKVYGFYKFKKLKFLKKNKNKLKNILLKKNIKGTIIISKEGINGTVSAKSNNVNFLSEKLKKYFALINLIVLICPKVLSNLLIKLKLKLKMKLCQ
tara:strand:- start:403 stop:693 length:291 start_codon:yes stop_codon:yes gene_type:complete